MYTDKERARFWAKVQADTSVDGCWTWTGATARHGYGIFNVRGTLKMAHRVAFAMATGRQPGKNELVLHSCDNPPCVRASHLRAGSHSENMDDRQTRDRTARGERHVSRTKPEVLMRGDSHYAKTEPERLARGEGHGMTSLTEAQVREIRQRYAGGWSARVLAKEYSVDRGTIYNVVKRRTWAHVS